MQAIRDDFDNLARVRPLAWDTNGHYHDFLLRQLPFHLGNTLDIGCGTGAFARLLAARSDHVLALDFSPEMIRVAREQSHGWKNIEFCLADAVAYALPVAHFDCIASIATMHHLPLPAMLEKCKHALKPGGVLLILDLVKGEGWRDAARNIPAFAWHLALMLAKTHRLRQPPEVRAAWDKHGLHDSYLRLSQVREHCARILPDARVYKHLLWRYSIVWKKPD